MREIRSIAREHGVETARLSKSMPIHAIRRDDGNFGCFATSCESYCGQDGCPRQTDRFAAAKEAGKAAA